MLENLDKVIWLALIVCAVVGEAMTVSFVSIWFAGGAAAALIVSLFGAPEWLQVVLFLAVTAALILVTRPLALKYVNSRRVATNADRNIGKTGIVTSDIDNIGAKGEVYIDGKYWSARSEDGKDVYKNAKVRVVRIEGVKLIVIPATSEISKELNV